MVFERDFNGLITAHKGYCYEIIHAVQKFYNFTQVLNDHRHILIGCFDAYVWTIFLTVMKLCSLLTRHSVKNCRMEVGMEWLEIFLSRWKCYPYFDFIGKNLILFAECRYWFRAIFRHALPIQSRWLFSGFPRRSYHHTDSSAGGRESAFSLH